MPDQAAEVRRVYISLSLESDEAERYTEVLRRALQRKPMASKSEVIRSLFDFPNSDSGLVLKEDRDYFFLRQGIKGISNGPSLEAGLIEEKLNGRMTDIRGKHTTKTPQTGQDSKQGKGKGKGR